MNTKTVYPSIRKSAQQTPRAARLALRLLESIDDGQLTIRLPDSTTRHFGRYGISATIDLANWNVFKASMRNGDIGFAQTYIDRDWDTNSLIDTLNLLIANRDGLEGVIYGHWAGRLLHRISHLMNRNSLRGAKRNIHAHYDLGNEFYAMWLDQSMTYSAALFDESDFQTNPNQCLAQGQKNKYQRILNQIDIKPDDRVLEIGCGWGGFAEAANSNGYSVRGLTLSTEQQAYARHRLAKTRHQGQTEIALQDYRDEHDQYDAIVSIEMFEAVGQEFWPAYFETIKRCLKPGAKAVIQTITIDEALFERYASSTDFIQQYIFPGGMLPSPERFSAAAGKAGLNIVDRFAFGLDYAKTLSVWRESFVNQLEQVQALGFDDKFQRTWEFYLAYCEAAFRNGNTNVYQFTLEQDSS